MFMSTFIDVTLYHTFLINRLSLWYIKHYERVTNLGKLDFPRNGVVTASFVQLPRKHNGAAIYRLILLLTPICTRGSVVNDAYCKA
jgi:hypothetical protein